MVIDLTKIYKNYKGQWVALDKTLSKVICANKNAQITYKKAVKLGYKVPTLFKIPKQNIAYFGMNLA